MKVDFVYLPHIHFIIMTTNRKEPNREMNKSIQIALAGPQRESKRERVGEGGGRRKPGKGTGLISIPSPT